MKRWVPLAFGCALLVALGFSSCGEDKPMGESPTAPIGATATAAPSATPRTVEPRTGIPEIDTLIDALLVEPARERREAIRPLLGSTKMACSFRADLVGQGENPPCHVDEQEDQLVDGFTFDSCGLSLLRADALDQVVILLGSSFMYGVYRPPTDRADEADYLAIVYQVTGGQQQAVQLLIKDGLIVSYLFSCASTPEEYVASLGLTDVVYQAEGGG